MAFTERSDRLKATIYTYKGARMTPKAFAISIEYAKNSGNKFIIKGCEVSKENVPSGNVLKVAAGWCMVKGRIVQVNAGTVTMTLPSTTGSTNYTICLVVDLTSGVVEPNNCYIAVGTGTGTDAANFNFNDTGHVYLPLASFSASNSGIVDSSITQFSNSSASTFYGDFRSVTDTSYTVPIAVGGSAWYWAASDSVTQEPHVNGFVPVGLEAGVYVINASYKVKAVSGQGLVTMRMVNKGSELGNAHDARITIPVTNNMDSTGDITFLYKCDGVNMPVLGIQLYASVNVKAVDFGSIWGFKIADEVDGF